MMKKIISILSVLLPIVAFGQFPINTPSGNAQTLNYQVGASGANIGFAWRASYADTSAANLGFGDGVPGMSIRVGDSIWIRSNDATRWINMMRGGGGSGSFPGIDDVLSVGQSLTTNRTIQGNSGTTSLSIQTPVTLAKSLYVSGVLTPDPITGNTNNYNPTGLDSATVIRISCDANSRRLTGIVSSGSADGRILYLQNVGDFTLRLESEASASSAANQFLFFGFFIDLPPYQSVTIQYNSTFQKWMLLNQPFRINSSSTIIVSTPDAFPLQGAGSLSVNPSGLLSNFWGTTGNAGTLSGTNFIGTTDNENFRFRVNNSNAGRLTSDSGTYFGYGSGEVNNTTTSSGFGRLALNQSTGAFNAAFGFGAMQRATTGEQNAAFGTLSLQFLTTGIKNTGLGVAALEQTTTGGFNTGVGQDAMLQNTTGSENVGVGWLGWSQNRTGNYNVGIGTSSGRSVVNGSQNVAIGYNSMYNGSQEDTVDNTIAIGAGTFTTKSNQMVLGNSLITETIIYGLTETTGPKSVFYDPATSIVTYEDAAPSLLFARTDARNETGNDMYFSAAGLDFEMDSIKNFTFRSIYETEQAWSNYIQSTIGSLNLFSGNDEDGLSQIIAQPTSISIESIGSGALGSGVNAVLLLSNIDQYAELKAIHAADGDHSRFSAYVDSAIIYSYDSNVYIYPLRHSVTATDKMLVWDSATGKVATRLLPAGGGSVTELTATDANGFDFTITDPTTTPNISLTTTVTNSQVMFSNSGAITGDVAFTYSKADGVAELVLGEGSDDGMITLRGTGSSSSLQAPASGTNIIELPTNAGTEGQVLTKGSGNATLWEDAGGAFNVTHSLFCDTLKAGSVIMSIVPRYNFFDDFIGSNNYLAGDVNFSEIASGSGANAGLEVDPQNIVGATGFGYGQLVTGTTVAGLAQMQITTLANRNVYGKVNNDYYYRLGFYNVVFDELSDGTNRYYSRVGFGQTNLSTLYAYVSYSDSLSSGVFVCHNKGSGGSEESTNTGITVAADTEYDIEIEFYNGTIKYWINGSLVATHNTNVPAAGANLHAPVMLIQKTAGVTSRAMYLDAVKVRIENENAVQN